MKTKCELKCVQTLVNFNQVFDRILSLFSSVVCNQLSTEMMPRFRPKPKPINGYKYSSFWFALKAIQNNKLLRNNSSINKSLSNQNSLLMNGFVDENQLNNKSNTGGANHNESMNPNPSDKMDTTPEESQKSDIKVFGIDAKKSLVLMTNKSCDYELAFGCVRITILSDNFDLELNGFTLTSGQSIELMAAFGHKIGIKLKFKDNQTTSHLTERLETLETKDIDSVLSQIDENSCLVLIEKLCLPSILFTENIPNFNPLNLKSDSDWFALRSVGTNNFEYFKVLDKLFDGLNLGQNDSVIVCGGQNVGKSSLIRYLINKYLSQNQSDSCDRHCLYLDCDPGQTEFTTAAQLSLTQITKPVLSSAAMNVLSNKPLMSCSVGANTPSKGPQLYISSVSQLIDFHKNSLQSKGPLFVNTMGWAQDLGLALLTDIIKITAPTHVIQIDSSVNQRINFSFDLAPDSVRKFNGFLRNPNYMKSGLNYKLSLISSDNKESKRSQIIRVSQQLTYFSQMPEILFKPFFSMTPIK